MTVWGALEAVFQGYVGTGLCMMAVVVVLGGRFAKRDGN